MSPKPISIEAQVLAELRRSFRGVELSSVLKDLGTHAELWLLGYCAIEDRFKITISEKERRGLVTVSDLTRLVASKVVV